MKIRQYVQNISLLFLINFSIKPLWVFAVERKFQLILGNEVFGLYFSFLNLIYILSTLLDLGLHSYTTKLISEQNDKSLRLESTLIFAKSILIIIYFILVLIASYFISTSNSDRWIFFLIGINQLLFSLIKYGRSFFQGYQLYKLDSIMSGLDRFFLLIFGGLVLALFYDQITLDSFLYLHFISFIICFIIQYLLLKNRLTFSINSIHFIELKAHIQKTWPLIIAFLFMAAYVRIETVLLKYLLPDGNLQAGIIAYSNRLTDSANNALLLISIFILPSVALQTTKNNQTQIRKLVFTAFGLSTMAALGYIGLCIWNQVWIYNTLYHDSSTFLLSIFKIHLWSVLGMGWTYVFGTYLIAIGRYKLVLALVSFLLILSFALYMYYIPISKAYGAALSTTIIQLVSGVIHMIGAFYFLFNQSQK